MTWPHEPRRIRLEWAAQHDAELGLCKRPNLARCQPDRAIEHGIQVGRAPPAALPRYPHHFLITRAQGDGSMASPDTLVKCLWGQLIAFAERPFHAPSIGAQDPRHFL